MNCNHPWTEILNRGVKSNKYWRYTISNPGQYAVGWIIYTIKKSLGSLVYSELPLQKLSKAVFLLHCWVCVQFLADHVTYKGKHTFIVLCWMTGISSSHISPLFIFKFYYGIATEQNKNLSSYDHHGLLTNLISDNIIKASCLPQFQCFCKHLNIPLFIVADIAGCCS